MRHLQVKLDGFQQNSFHRHNLFFGVVTKTLKLFVGEKLRGGVNNLFALLRCLLNLPSEEKATAPCSESGELLETVEHIEPVEVDYSCGHSVVLEAKLRADFENKSCTLAPVSHLLLGRDTINI